jgi:hypothetical protein
MSKKMKKQGQTVMVIVASMPAVMEAVYRRPDRFGTDGAFEYRVAEWIRADCEAEACDAEDDGIDVNLSDDDIRDSVDLLGTTFVDRPMAEKVLALLGIEADDEEAAR